MAGSFGRCLEISRVLCPAVASTGESSMSCSIGSIVPKPQNKFKFANNQALSLSILFATLNQMLHLPLVVLVEFSLWSRRKFHDSGKRSSPERSSITPSMLMTQSMALAESVPPARQPCKPPNPVTTQLLFSSAAAADATAADEVFFLLVPLATSQGKEPPSRFRGDPLRAEPLSEVSCRFLLRSPPHSLLKFKKEMELIISTWKNLGLYNSRPLTVWWRNVLQGTPLPVATSHWVGLDWWGCSTGKWSTALLPGSSPPLLCRCCRRVECVLSWSEGRGAFLARLLSLPQ